MLWITQIIALADISYVGIFMSQRLKSNSDYCRYMLVSFNDFGRNIKKNVKIEVTFLYKPIHDPALF